MKRLVLILTIVAIAVPSPSEACHIFSRWHYPYRQRCFTAYAPTQPKRLEIRTRTVPKERIEIIIPPLEWLPCPIGDERMQGIAKLRGLM